MLSLCNENITLFPPVNPSNRITSPLLASLHPRAGTILKGVTKMEKPIESASVNVMRYSRGKPVLSPEYRFWRMVDKNGPTPPHCPELGPCWVWTGATSICCKLRYGKFNIGDGKIAYAHKFSWNIHFGDTGDCTLHKCDNTLCVNPGHLFNGTKLDNMRDMIAKGRARHDITPRGRQHYTYKIKHNETHSN